MLNTPFPPWPSFTSEEGEAVRRVLLSNRVNYWTGTETREFEQEFAEWSDSKFAIAVSNGTVALDAALNAASIGPGTEVIVTPRTFIASASSIAMTGSTPVFVDIDPDTQNITADSIQPAITARTRAIVCVHLAGMPCDMDPIIELAAKHRLIVIEDCAQAHGARYKGRPVGSIGDIGTWSFCQDKIMTTGGEGGMITTNDKALWSKMWSYKDHGKNWDAVYKQQHPAGFRWLHQSFGTNGRMIEMQAAIGRIQLRRMKDWHSMRVTNAKRIWAAANDLPGLRAPEIPDWADHAAYKCYVFLDDESEHVGERRDALVASISEDGVPCYSGSCSEVYREDAFEYTGNAPEQRLSNAQLLGDSSVMFLVHPTLEKRHIDLACSALQRAVKSDTEDPAKKT